MGPLVLRTLQTNKQLSLLVHIKFNTQTSSSVKYCSYCYCCWYVLEIFADLHTVVGQRPRTSNVHEAKGMFSKPPRLIGCGSDQELRVDY